MSSTRTAAEDRQQTILIAEDDEVTRSFLGDNLAADRYRVRVADSREKALAILAVDQPDVVVVDINGDTLDLIDAIRSGDGLAGRVDPDTPLIVLTARADELHRIRALERGGDDVVSKPFSYVELRARIAALLRRAEARRAPRIFRLGVLTIDVAARVVKVGEDALELTAKEYDLLRTLASEPTRVFTREELLRSVWRCESFGSSRTLDSHACRLRRRLSDAGADALVVNCWGVGYRLADPMGSGPTRAA